MAVGAREDREAKSGHRYGIFRKWGRPSGQVWILVWKILHMGSALTPSLDTGTEYSANGVVLPRWK